MEGYCSLYLTTFKDVDHFVLFHPDIPTRNVYIIISDPIPQIWVLLPSMFFPAEVEHLLSAGSVRIPGRNDNPISGMGNNFHPPK